MIPQELLLLLRRHALHFLVYLLAELHHALMDSRMILQEFAALLRRHLQQFLNHRLYFALGRRGGCLCVKG